MQSIGTLEETILLLVLIHQGEAYGVSIRDAYVDHAKRGITIPAIHTVLKRLEKKGYLKSKMDGATSERGGRRKRLFEVTPNGYHVLQELRNSREQLWSAAPKLSFN